jgi:hypothetical protein
MNQHKIIVPVTTDLARDYQRFLALLQMLLIQTETLKLDTKNPVPMRKRMEHYEKNLKWIMREMTTDPKLSSQQALDMKLHLECDEMWTVMYQFDTLLETAVSEHNKQVQELCAENT